MFKIFILPPREPSECEEERTLAPIVRRARACPCPLVERCARLDIDSHLWRMVATARPRAVETMSLEAATATTALKLEKGQSGEFRACANVVVSDRSLESLAKVEWASARPRDLPELPIARWQLVSSSSLASAGSNLPDAQKVGAPRASAALTFTSREEQDEDSSSCNARTLCPSSCIASRAATGRVHHCVILARSTDSFRKHFRAAEHKSCPAKSGHDSADWTPRWRQRIFS